MSDSQHKTEHALDFFRRYRGKMEEMFRLFPSYRADHAHALRRECLKQVDGIDLRATSADKVPWETVVSITDCMEFIAIERRILEPLEAWGKSVWESMEPIHPHRPRFAHMMAEIALKRDDPRSAGDYFAIAARDREIASKLSEQLEATGKSNERPERRCAIHHGLSQTDLDLSKILGATDPVLVGAILKHPATEARLHP